MVKLASFQLIPASKSFILLSRIPSISDRRDVSLVVELLVATFENLSPNLWSHSVLLPPDPEPTSTARAIVGVCTVCVSAGFFVGLVKSSDGHNI